MLEVNPTWGRIPFYPYPGVGCVLRGEGPVSPGAGAGSWGHAGGRGALGVRMRAWVSGGHAGLGVRLEGAGGFVGCTGGQGMRGWGRRRTGSRCLSRLRCFLLLALPVMLLEDVAPRSSFKTLPDSPASARSVYLHTPEEVRVFFLTISVCSC